MGNRLSTKNKYPSPFSLRLSHSQYSELKRLAGGIPIGTYIKDTLFKHKQRPRRASQYDHKLLAMLLGALGKSRIASNINQLARAANSGSLPVNEEVLKSLKEAVEAILWMRDTLIKLLRVKPHRRDKDYPYDPER